jgi:hypothetical protein
MLPFSRRRCHRAFSGDTRFADAIEPLIDKEELVHVIPDTEAEDTVT